MRIRTFCHGGSATSLPAALSIAPLMVCYLFKRRIYNQYHVYKYTRVMISEDTLTAIHSFCNFDFIDTVNDAIMLCNFTSSLSPACNILCNDHISHLLQLSMQ